MFKRLTGAVPAAVIATLVIVFSMQALLAHGKPAITDTRTPKTLEIPPPMDESELRVNERFVPPEFDEPVPVPKFRPEVSTDSTAVNIRTSVAPPPIADKVVLAGSSSSSPLVAVMRSQPIYPKDLAARGIEGHVDLVFDVLPSGRVVNVTVAEASHRGFVRAAIRAAERSRFKPAVVDGIPQASTGVRFRMSFRLES